MTAACLGRAAFACPSAAASRQGGSAPTAKAPARQHRLGVVSCAPATPLRGRFLAPGPGCGRQGIAQVHSSRHAAASASARQQVFLPVQDLTPESFAPFGQVCSAQDDGKVFDGEDAQLVLDNGTPRFYIMRLPKTGISFNRITFHDKVTQCLGGLSPDPWYMAVSAPSGSVKAHPTTDTLAAFRVPPGTFLKLNEGTWHAGPLFATVEHMDFYNLELSDTNVVDHNTHEYEDMEYVLEV